MSDNFVQQGFNSNTTTCVATLAGVVAGNSIVAFLFNAGTGGGITGVSDGQGAYTIEGPQATDSTNNVRGQAFVLQNANAGSHTITGTVQTGDNCVIIVVEVGSSAGVSAFSGANSQFQSGPGTGTDAVSSRSVTVTGAATLIAFSTDSSSVNVADEPAVGTGFTTRLNNTDSSIGAYRLESGAVAANIAGTFTANTGTDNFVTLAVAILNSSGAAAAPYAALRQSGPGISPDKRQQFKTKPLSNQITVQPVVPAPYALLRSSGPGIGPDATKVFRARQFGFPSASVALNGSGLSSSIGAAALVGTLAMAGSGISASVGAGNLTGSLPVSGSGISASVGSGALTGSAPLSGSGVAASTGSGALTGSGAFAGSGIATTVGAGGSTGSGALSASGVSVTIGAANLLGSAGLSGSGISVSIGSADLEPFNSGATAGSGISTSIGSGNLTASLALSGFGISVTMGSGDMTPPAVVPTVTLPVNQLLPGVPPKTAIELERGYKYPWQATGDPIVPSPFLGSSETLQPGIAAASQPRTESSELVQTPEDSGVATAISDDQLLVLMLGYIL
jgi:fibronectin-binding autotransporter adhesin